MTRESHLPDMMTLARVHGPGDVRLDDYDLPACGRGDVLVQVAACGICGSDLSYIAQGGLGGVEPLLAPLPIGHEFAGTVVTVGGDVQGVAEGMRVAVNPDLAGIGNGGPDGAMAHYVRVGGAKLGETLFALPDTLSFAEASLAEPLSVALHGLRVAGVTADDRVAILGAGPIGLCAVVMLRELGVRDIAIFDRVPERLDRARALGAGLAIDISREAVPDALARYHGSGDRYGAKFVETDVFVDCAGSAAAMAELVSIAKYRARIAVIALHHKPLELDLWRLMANEIALLGSIADARASEFGAAVAMLAEGRWDLSALISHRMAFSQFHDALCLAADPARAAKVVVTFAEAA
jgi:L-iditol 2-dehydrogenase